MGFSINVLPTEVLFLVLRKLLTLESASFVTSLTVCRLWHEIGTDYLYTDISLTGRQIHRFDRAVAQQLRFARSLTLSLDPHCYHDDDTTLEETDTASVYLPFLRTRVLWHDLDLLASKVQLMTKLEAFSLRVCGNHLAEPTEGFFLRRADIAMLIGILPPSLRILELDAFNHDRDSASWTDTHLCRTLATMLPKLSHLRLRLSRVCKDIFSAITSDEALSKARESVDLKRRNKLALVMNTVDEQRAASTTLCGNPHSWRYSTEIQQEKSVSLMSELGIAIDQIQKLGPAEVIKSTIIIQALEPPVHLKSSKFGCGTINKMTLPSATVDKYPYHVIDDAAGVRHKSKEGQDVEIFG